MTFLPVAVRQVAASHKMVAQGHTTVAEGWNLFKEAVEEATLVTHPTFCIN